MAQSQPYHHHVEDDDDDGHYSSYITAATPNGNTNNNAGHGNGNGNGAGAGNGGKGRSSNGHVSSLSTGASLLTTTDMQSISKTRASLRDEAYIQETFKELIQLRIHAFVMISCLLYSYTVMMAPVDNRAVLVALCLVSCAFNNSLSNYQRTLAPNQQWKCTIFRIVVNSMLTISMAYADYGNIHSPIWNMALLGTLTGSIDFTNGVSVVLNAVQHSFQIVWCGYCAGVSGSTISGHCFAQLILAVFFSGAIQILRSSRQAMHMSIDRKKLYLAHISHELRTPLTGILGITSLLKEEIAPTMDTPHQLSSSLPTPTAMAMATRASFADTDHHRSSLSSSSHTRHSYHQSTSPSSSTAGSSPGDVGRDSAELFQLVHTLSVCTKSLLNIANDVLDISKLEEGGYKLKEDRVNIHEIVMDVIELARASALNLKRDIIIDYHIEFPLSSSYVITDAQRLRQMLINLCNNSIKFTTHGSVIVSVTQHKYQPPVAPSLYPEYPDDISLPGEATSIDRRHVPIPPPASDDGELTVFVFHVADTGCGVKPEMRTMIFEPFIQGEQVNKDIQGTGLGLYITRKLAESFHGGIHVTGNEIRNRSIPGNDTGGDGSIFHLHTTLRRVPPPPNDATTSATPSLSLTSNNHDDSHGAGLVQWLRPTSNTSNTTTVNTPIPAPGSPTRAGIMNGHGNGNGHGPGNDGYTGSGMAHAHRSGSHTPNRSTSMLSTSGAAVHARHRLTRSVLTNRNVRSPPSSSSSSSHTYRRTSNGIDSGSASSGDDSDSSTRSDEEWRHGLRSRGHTATNARIASSRAVGGISSQSSLSSSSDASSSKQRVYDGDEPRSNSPLLHAFNGLADRRTPSPTSAPLLPATPPHAHYHTPLLIDPSSASSSASSSSSSSPSLVSSFYGPLTIATSSSSVSTTAAVDDASSLIRTQDNNGSTRKRKNDSLTASLLPSSSSSSTSSASSSSSSDDPQTKRLRDNNHPAPHDTTTRNNTNGTDESIADSSSSHIQSSRARPNVTSSASSPSGTAPPSSTSTSTSTSYVSINGASHSSHTGVPSLPILLVEDVAVNRAILTRMLHRLGVTAHVASNGDEAVNIASQREYATILMDCQMPICDGYEATHRIRTGNGPNVRTRIVALTAAVLPGDREKCIRAGMDGYCSKPISFTTLRQIVLSNHTNGDASNDAQSP